MALNSSGPLSLGGATAGQSVNLELAKAATALVSLNDTDLRTLFGVASGTISLSTGYGKSRGASKSHTGNFEIWLYATETMGASAVASGAGQLVVNSGPASYQWSGFQAGPVNRYSHVTDTFTTAAFYMDAVSYSDGYVNKNSAGNLNSTTRGYWGGGSSGPQSGVPDISAIEFATETALGYVANLAQSRNQLQAVSGPENDKGYFAGGRLEPSFNQTWELDGIQFSTQTTINPGAGPYTVNRQSSISRWNSGSRAYWAGGIFPAQNYSTIDGLIWATDSNISTGASLVQARGSTGGHSLERGFSFGGGHPQGPSGISFNQIDGMQFSTETTLDPGTGLNANRGASGGGTDFAGNNSS
jgi:hypothetical protein